MSDVEKQILKMYDGSFPDEKTLFDISHVNHVAWSLAVLFGALAIWLAVALVNAENQRYALLSKQCQDPVFKGEVDLKCLSLVHSRAHWWQHLGYGVSHLNPEMPKSKP